jgi:hypothetical protein
MAELFADNLPRLLLWGLIATVVMTSVLEGSQGLGLSRLSLPFLVGTMFTAHRNKAVVIGFIVYVLGGWVFAMLYFLFFASIGRVSWLLGALIGALHGVLLLVGALPLLAYAHPRMASEHDGPRDSFLLEPPGFCGLNYGRRTPLTTLLGQTLYGAALGGLCQLGGLFTPG